MRRGERELLATEPARRPIRHGHVALAGRPYDDERLVSGRVPRTRGRRSLPMDWLWTLMFRDLRKLPPDLRTAALEWARATPMTAVESTGVVLSILVVTVATPYLIGDTPGSRLEVFAYRFVLALPLLTASVGSCHAARLRRGVKAWPTRKGTTP